jgi:hypothetical protein
MTAVLADAAVLAVNPLWIARVQAGLCRVSFLQANAILQMENPTPKDKLRLKLYNDVVRSPDLYGPMFAWTLASYPFVESTNTDDEIATYIGSFIDIFARITV